MVLLCAVLGGNRVKTNRSNFKCKVLVVVRRPRGKVVLWGVVRK